MKFALAGQLFWFSSLVWYEKSLWGLWYANYASTDPICAHSVWHYVEDYVENPNLHLYITFYYLNYIQNHK